MAYTEVILCYISTIVRLNLDYAVEFWYPCYRMNIGMLRSVSRRMSMILGFVAPYCIPNGVASLDFQIRCTRSSKLFRREWCDTIKMYLHSMALHINCVVKGRSREVKSISRIANKAETKKYNYTSVGVTTIHRHQHQKRAKNYPYTEKNFNLLWASRPPRHSKAQGT